VREKALFVCVTPCSPALPQVCRSLLTRFSKKRPTSLSFKLSNPERAVLVCVTPCSPTLPRTGVRLKYSWVWPPGSVYVCVFLRAYVCRSVGAWWQKIQTRNLGRPATLSRTFWAVIWCLEVFFLELSFLAFDLCLLGHVCEDSIMSTCHIRYKHTCHIFITTNMPTYIPSYIHAYMKAYRCLIRYKHTCQLYITTNMPTNVPSYIHIYMPSCMHAHTYAFMSTCLIPYMHTCHTNITTCKYTYLHT